uniref:Uncharacterized protein n=1 Tax=Arundo donax TaxID=35708 RepID=A0A0A9CQ53_ARUDO
MHFHHRPRLPDWSSQFRPSRHRGWPAKASVQNRVLDQVGAGFSYSIIEQGYKSSDTKAVNQILIFLRKWFDAHPEFLSNPLYMGGDSYSGMIVPTVTSGIAKGYFPQLSVSVPLFLFWHKHFLSSHMQSDCAARSLFLFQVTMLEVSQLGI